MDPENEKALDFVLARLTGKDTGNNLKESKPAPSLKLITSPGRELRRGDVFAWVYSIGNYAYTHVGEKIETITPVADSIFRKGVLDSGVHFTVYNSTFYQVWREGVEDTSLEPPDAVEMPLCALCNTSVRWKDVMSQALAEDHNGVKGAKDTFLFAQRKYIQQVDGLTNKLFEITGKHWIEDDR